MRRRSRTTGKLPKTRSRKAKILKATRHSSSSVAGQETEVARFHRERDEALRGLTPHFKVARRSGISISINSGECHAPLRSSVWDFVQIRRQAVQQVGRTQCAGRVA